MLSPTDALGQWLKLYEPHWAAAIERLEAKHELSPSDKFIIAGYWAHLSTCTPTWQRVSAKIQQEEIDEVHLQKFVEYVATRPGDFPNAEKYLPLVKAGRLRPTIDPNYPKAVATKQLLEHLWVLYHQEWNVVYNNTEELFLTSDNPSIFDHEYGTELHPARYLPITPRLALWTNIDTTGIPKTVDPNVPPQRKSIGREATLKYVKDMNVLTIKSAERFVLAAADKAYIPVCVRKYKHWRVSREVVRRIPAGDGHYEVLQTRAWPQEASEKRT
jgi:hypothetical protein